MTRSIANCFFCASRRGKAVPSRAAALNAIAFNEVAVFSDRTLPIAKHVTIMNPTAVSNSRATPERILFRIAPGAHASRMLSLSSRKKLQPTTILPRLILFSVLLLSCLTATASAVESTNHSQLKIQIIDPPEREFFTKQISFHGIPIKAPAVVVDEALFAAYDRLNLLLQHQPMAISNLVAAGVELHTSAGIRSPPTCPNGGMTRGNHYRNTAD